jgi:hypothetical protein
MFNSEREPMGELVGEVNCLLSMALAFNKLTWLIAREDFINESRHET